METTMVTSTVNTVTKTGMPRDRGVLLNAQYLKICFEKDADQVFVEYGAPSGDCAHIQGDIWRVHADGFQPPSGTIYLSLRYDGEKSPWKEFAAAVENEDEIWIFVNGDITKDNKWQIDLMSAVQENVHSRMKIYHTQSFAPPKNGIPKVCQDKTNPIPVMTTKTKR